MQPPRGLNIREQPSGQSARVGAVPGGAAVAVLERRGEWLLVQWQELQGWRWREWGFAFASAVVHLPKLLFSPRLDSPGERGRGAGTLVRLRLVRMVWMLAQAAGRARCRPRT